MSSPAREHAFAPDGCRACGRWGAASVLMSVAFFRIYFARTGVRHRNHAPDDDWRSTPLRLPTGNTQTHLPTPSTPPSLPPPSYPLTTPSRLASVNGPDPLNTLAALLPCGPVCGGDYGSRPAPALSNALLESDPVLVAHHLNLARRDCTTERLLGSAAQHVSAMHGLSDSTVRAPCSRENPQKPRTRAEGALRLRGSSQGVHFWRFIIGG